MKISASITNGGGEHKVTVETNLASQSLSIPVKASGSGSAVNGGEMLFLAIGTCFCNDIYREAVRRNMRITAIDIVVTGNFGGEGVSARDIEYSVNITAPDHTSDELSDLIRYVDEIAEVHNTIRKGTPVLLKP